jgi:RNA polymerase sigma-70 factor (ECF subfamily)
MNLAEEKQLLDAIKKNPERFGELFDLHYKTIFNYVLRRTGNYDVSRDISADIFLKTYLNIKSFKWKNISILSWLYRIATNEVSYFYRKNKSTKIFEEAFFIQSDKLFEAEEYQKEKQLMEEEMKKDQDFVKVQKALKQLDIKYQEVLSLRFFEKKSILEIAEILDKKEGTIKSLLSRGLDKLKILINSTLTH